MFFPSRSSIMTLVVLLTIHLQHSEARRLLTLSPSSQLSEKADALVQKSTDALTTIATRSVDHLAKRASDGLDKLASHQPGDAMKKFTGSFDQIFKKQPQEINVVVPVPAAGTPAASPAPRIQSLPTNPPSSININGPGPQTLTRTPTVIENPFKLVAPTKITDLSSSQGSKLGGLSQLLGTLFGYTVPGSSQTPSPSGPPGLPRLPLLP